jgi:hypothetical protein
VGFWGQLGGPEAPWGSLWADLGRHRCVLYPLFCVSKTLLNRHQKTHTTNATRNATVISGGSGVDFIPCFAGQQKSWGNHKAKSTRNATVSVGPFGRLMLINSRILHANTLLGKTQNNHKTKATRIATVVSADSCTEISVFEGPSGAPMGDPKGNFGRQLDRKQCF